ncbi:AAA family ATPase [Staphylococcus simulans]|uniref:AAA family ATPase n=1 Tax=Staphylococcus simulans TaxID=1286 RepID=UPI002902369A|nr:AAA family ATPase [Staphylococcus simulans]MDU0419545.1 AAA family ATPase [Staphylococcus simulans]MDU0466659.1 AAA family ATPase [Staphylococcus simulans]
MYLKSLSLKNYRKFRNNSQTIDFAHSEWEIQNESDEVDQNKLNKEAAEKYISRSSSLIVGKNNAGKSTIITLLNTLQNAKSGSRNTFKSYDFNLNYLKNWFEKNIINKTSSEIDEISQEDLPNMEFYITIGVDNEEDIISNFEDVLILSGIESPKDDLQTSEVAEIKIKIKYEVADRIRFLEALHDIKSFEININHLDLSAETKIRIKGNNDLVKLSTLKSYNEDVSNDESIVISNIVKFYEQLHYRKFLDMFNNDYYILNFYPNEVNEPSKNFSLKNLLKVRTIEANTVKSNTTLTEAYNKIVRTYIANFGLENIDEVINSMNFKLKGTIDSEIKNILQNAVTSIESTKNLQMNLQPDITLSKLFANSIIYEYQEEDNYIPESQFGMGYTNLMVIIANIVDYIELYEENDTNGSINILCIEEPESFMHPQMQELFIKNISKAIAFLLGEKGRLDTFQLIISTHSSYIVNSKIQSGNSLDNIVYLGHEISGQTENVVVKNINDEKLKKGDINNYKVYEYVKKYLRMELSDIFFAEALILVEGISEDIYMKYLIDQDVDLRNRHVKIYRIEGAHAHKFFPLLKLLDIKTIIISDLDLYRTSEDKQIKLSEDDESEKLPLQITSLTGYPKENNINLTTNGTLNHFIKNEIDEVANTININHKLRSEFTNGKAFVSLQSGNINLFTQCCINGYYASSFEEAIILTNGSDHSENRSSLINLFAKTRPQTKYFNKISEEFNILEKSYYYQKKLSDSKSIFATELVYMSITEDSFSIKKPEYIEAGLQELIAYFGDEDNE